MVMYLYDPSCSGKGLREECRRLVWMHSATEIEYLTSHMFIFAAGDFDSRCQVQHPLVLPAYAERCTLSSERNPRSSCGNVIYYVKECRQTSYSIGPELISLWKGSYMHSRMLGVWLLFCSLRWPRKRHRLRSPEPSNIKVTKTIASRSIL